MIRTPLARGPGLRRGFGLIELMTAMFVFSVAIALFVAFLEVVLKISNGGSDHLDRLVVTSRLARALRADVHAAHSAELTGPVSGAAATRLRLALGQNVWVEYAAERDQVRRERIEGSVAKQQEQYPLERSAGAWSIEQVSGSILVGLRLDRRLSPRRSSAPRPIRIEAVLGRDHRFEPGGPP